jgi:hypothetical protein
MKFKDAIAALAQSEARAEKKRQEPTANGRDTQPNDQPLNGHRKPSE